MMRIAFALSVCGMLCCVPKVQVVPDPTVPHQVAEAAQVSIWARTPDGKLAKQQIQLPAGWWVAGPPVTDPLPAAPTNGGTP
jgi:hypothetical protein